MLIPPLAWCNEDAERTYIYEFTKWILLIFSYSPLTPIPETVKQILASGKESLLRRVKYFIIQVIPVTSLVYRSFQGFYRKWHGIKVAFRPTNASPV
jgi:hypothetical protein